MELRILRTRAAQEAEIEEQISKCLMNAPASGEVTYANRNTSSSSSSDGLPWTLSAMLLERTLVALAKGLLFFSPPFTISCRVFWVGIFLSLFFVSSAFGLTSSETSKRKVEELGGNLFFEKGKVVEVVLNKTQVEDKDLTLLEAFPHMRDLSLENTRIGNAGMVHAAKLPKLEWLNLYRTWVGDDGARSLAESKSLKMLPIGETNLTDKGLVHLSRMRQLTYLGLRGNNVTDKGVLHLGKLIKLEGLYLGETRVTDAGVRMLLALKGLKKLWLHDLPITDDSIKALSTMKNLQELHVYATKISSEGAKSLQSALPKCRVIHESLTN